MHSAAPPEAPLLLRSRRRRDIAVVVLVLAGVQAGAGRLAGQTAESPLAFDAQPAWPNAAAMPAAWMAPPAALPPSLTPDAVGADGPMSIQGEQGPLPYLFGIFGGIAGMFVADWWEDRNCDENCGQANIPMLFLGGGLGAIIGYLIGGGELPEPPPGR
jgi:hypothetical protein